MAVASFNFVKVVLLAMFFSMPQFFMFVFIIFFGESVFSQIFLLIGNQLLIFPHSNILSIKYHLKKSKSKVYNLMFYIHHQKKSSVYFYKTKEKQKAQPSSSDLMGKNQLWIDLIVEKIIMCVYVCVLTA